MTTRALTIALRATGRDGGAFYACDGRAFIVRAETSATTPAPGFMH